MSPGIAFGLIFIPTRRASHDRRHRIPAVHRGHLRTAGVAMTLFDWVMLWLGIQLPLGMFVGAYIRAGRG